MIGSLIGAQAIATALRADATIQRDLGSRILHGVVIPGDVPLPALMFYMDAATPIGPIDREGTITGMVCQFTARVAVPGDSHEPIIDAYLAMRAALHGLDTSVTFRGMAYHVAITFAAEFTPTQAVEQTGERFSQLGDTYTVEIFKEG